MSGEILGVQLVMAFALGAYFEKGNVLELLSAAVYCISILLSHKSPPFQNSAIF
jgi:hypothetical protein